MSDGSDKNGAAPLTVTVSWGGLALIVALCAVWWAGVVHLDEFLQVDTQCEDKRYYGRGAEFAETARCALDQGLGGWIYLAWTLVLPLGLLTWMERSLRKSILARRHISPRD